MANGWYCILNNIILIISLLHSIEIGYMPRAPMIPIFEGHPPPKKNKAFSNQNTGHLGSRCIYILCRGLGFLHFWQKVYTPMMPQLPLSFDPSRGPWGSQSLPLPSWLFQTAFIEATINIQYSRYRVHCIYKPKQQLKMLKYMKISQMLLGFFMWVLVASNFTSDPPGEEAHISSQPALLSRWF